MNERWFFDNIGDLKKAVSEARITAKREARGGSDPWIFSRGAHLSTANARGDQCGPREEASEPGWDGTWRQVRQLVDDVRANYPHVCEVYIAGGFDAANSLIDRTRGNYDPWVSSWHVLVWRREASR